MSFAPETGSPAQRDGFRPVPRPTGTGEAGLSAAGPSPLQRPLAADSIIASRLPTVEYMGGRLLRRPMLHTLTFTSDDPAIAARLEHFGDVITTSSWWREATADYCAAPGDCIGPGEPGRHVRLGVIDANTLLIVYLPPDVEFRRWRGPQKRGTDPRTLCG